MNPTPDSSETPVPVRTRRSFWRQLGGGSLSISLFLHLVMLGFGVFWVLKVIPPIEKDVSFMPTSGGSEPASEAKAKQRAQTMQTDLSRVAARDALGAITLPEPDALNRMVSLGGMNTGISAGLGGFGNGGGTGIGSGLAPGMSDGAGNKTPFGSPLLDKKALVGTFYDLKQTPERRPTGMTNSEMIGELREIVKRGFKERSLDKFYQAPRRLYQTRFLIPAMKADGAPAAFDCEKEVEPTRWAVVYRGAVRAPKSGRFRFVGAGDDVLVVRFDNRPVLDFGYTIAGAGTTAMGATRISELEGGVRNSELEKLIRKETPMRVPFTYYRYSELTQFNNGINGLAAGAEFEVREGADYPIEILIAEIPGGSFGVYLLIEEIGADYRKAPSGSPILPLFRLDHSLPPAEGQVPPIDPNGPVWQFVPGGAKKDI